jgi:hypothetical protein
MFPLHNSDGQLHVMSEPLLLVVAVVLGLDSFTQLKQQSDAGTVKGAIFDCVSSIGLAPNVASYLKVLG